MAMTEKPRPETLKRMRDARMKFFGIAVEDLPESFVNGVALRFERGQRLQPIRGFDQLYQFK